MRKAIILILCAPALVLAADPPYAGQWKINPARSDSGAEAIWRMSAAWKIRNFNSSSPQAMTLTPRGSDALVFSMGNEIGACEARFDGKPYPVNGSTWESGWTCTVTETAGRQLQIAWRKDGRVIYASAITISEDLQTLTETSTAANGEKLKTIFDRDHILADPPLMRPVLPLMREMMLPRRR